MTRIREEGLSAKDAKVAKKQQKNIGAAARRTCLRIDPRHPR
jgi:hypothetical protein